MIFIYGIFPTLSIVSKEHRCKISKDYVHILYHMVLSIMSGNLPPGESLTFGSLTFVTDGAGWFYIKPPSFPGRTTFFGSLRFVIDRYGDLRLRVPPPYLAVGVLPSEPMSPIPPASGFWDDDLAFSPVLPERGVRPRALGLAAAA